MSAPVTGDAGAEPHAPLRLVVTGASGFIGSRLVTTALVGGVDVRTFSRSVTGVPAAVSAAHLGGTLPFSRDEDAFALAPDGRLHGTANVYVADGSGFRFLPAKGVTLTLMANAHRVAEAVGRA